MRRRLFVVLIAVAAVVLASAGTASAHPLGNFTVNHYAGIELAGNRVYVHYALDLAEIPTFSSAGMSADQGSPRPSRDSSSSGSTGGAPRFGS
jgi:nickel/cobalt exporter